MLTVVGGNVAPSAVVAVTVTVAGPTGVGAGPDMLLVQPARAPVASASRTSVR
jgi:hypothetical protein